MSEIFPGVRHYRTSGFAETWEAYDALTGDDWTEISEGVTTWKEGTLDDRVFVVFAPHGSRQEKAQ